MKIFRYILWCGKHNRLAKQYGTIQIVSKLNINTTSHVYTTSFEKLKRCCSSQQFCSLSEISIRKASVQTSSFTATQQNKVLEEHKQKKPNTSEIKRLLALAKPEISVLAGAFTLLALSSTITMSVPFALGKVIDIIYTNDVAVMKENLNQVCLWLSAIFVVGGVSNFGRVYLINRAGERITKSLRSNIFKSIVHQETAYFDRAKTGELVNRLSTDTSLVSQSLTMNISNGLRSMVVVTAGVGMMFYMSKPLALVGLSIVPPVAVMAIFYGKYLRNISKNIQDSLAAASQVAEERISNIRTVKSFGQEAKEISKYNSNITSVLHMAYKEALARGIFFGITGFSGNVIVLTVLYYGGSLVTDSQLSVGNLSSFLLYAAYVSISMAGVSSFYSEMNKGLGAASRLFQLIDRQPSINDNEGLQLRSKDLEGDIVFKDISFCYPSRPEDKILRNFNLCVKSGSIVALVGASGSGKSTVGSLLLRLYDPQEGEISLNNLAIPLLKPVWLRSKIGYVAQEPILFSTTILENILYGSQHDNVPMEKVRLAAQEANALEFIEAFPDSFNTIVGERGIMLSGGQRQRVAIARVLISEPKILLLDEATSALDAHSESLVQEALERLMKGRTVITIAHRLSTIRNANSIAVLKDGQVAEMGTFEELYKKNNGLFRELIEKQTLSGINS